MSAKAAEKEKNLIIQPGNFTENTSLFTAMASGGKCRVREGYTYIPNRAPGSC